MSYYQRMGDVPPKRHTRHHADGARLHEELMGQEGFSSSSSLLYHRHSPSAIVNVEAVDEAECHASPDRPLVPRHILTGELSTGVDVSLGKTTVLANDHVRIGWVDARESGPLYRNAAGDELVFVHHGDAVLESVFGSLAVGPGDYVLIPAATTHRWSLDHGPVSMLTVETRGHVTPPPRYRSSQGQFLEHAPYCERDIRIPTGPLLVEGERTPVIVRNRAGLSRHLHARHPFDVVGWDGTIYPWALNISDFEPIVGRLHQPPIVHQTFAGPGFVVCSFVPRMLDFHPDAVKVPYHHANTDSDEVLFYADGDFTSRSGSGIGVGSISFHPAGFVHGPQPGSFEASIDRDRTEETAVMIDTFSPLHVTNAARAASVDGYPWTWAT